LQRSALRGPAEPPARWAVDHGARRTAVPRPREERRRARADAGRRAHERVRSTARSLPSGRSRISPATVEQAWEARFACVMMDRRW
jgi:hypothetical protein